MAKKPSNLNQGLNPGELGSELPEQNSEVAETASDIQEDGTASESAEPEQVAEKTKPVTRKFKKEVVVSGAEFWEFDESKDGADGHVFIGQLLNTVTREKDGPKAATNPNEKAGSVMGFTMQQHGTGARFIIGNSHAIQKALEKDGYKKETLWEIEFLGKGAKSDGQMYNRFECSRLIEE